ncbi:hypothetical protein EAF00_007463 [Botryotinia globosa]|nr:hypothetical protein EAF00_007463 [Botryotinia globosa]
MKYQPPNGQEVLTTTETERSQKIRYRKLILNSEIMESAENSDQVNGSELILKSTRSTDIQTLGIQTIVERQHGVSNPDDCVDDAIETKTRQVTINDLSHDILMNIFDELNSCMVTFAIHWPVVSFPTKPLSLPCIAKLEIGIENQPFKPSVGSGILVMESTWPT